MIENSSNLFSLSEFASELDSNFNQPELKRSSINAILSLFNERDEYINDDLSRSQRSLRSIREKISQQNRKKFALENRLQTLISSSDKLKDHKHTLEKIKKSMEFDYDSEATIGPQLTEDILVKFGSLVYELQTDPRHISILFEFSKSSQVDFLVETIVFSLFGKQFDSRQEHLLLLVFKNLLNSSIKSTTDSYNMLRGNSPLTKLMSTYTRRGQGQDYLRTVLSQIVGPLVERDDLVHDFDLDPFKIYEKLVLDGQLDPSTFLNFEGFEDSKLIFENEKVVSILKSRTLKFLDVASSVIKIIFENADKVPFGIRWICKQISVSFSLEKKNNQNLDPLLLVGSFFFLRFINPSIINPLLYLEVDSIKLEKSKKILLLIAKTIQLLANKPTSSIPESQNQPDVIISCQTISEACYSDFFAAHCHQKDQFLTNLCHVEDFDDKIFIEHYSFLISEPQIMDFTSKELFHLHSSFLDQINSFPDRFSSKIKDLVDEISPTELKLDPNDDYKVSLVLNPKSKSDFKFDPTSCSEFVSNFDVMFIEAKSLLVMIIRSSPELFKSIIDDFYLGPSSDIYKFHKPRDLDLFEIANNAASSCKNIKIVKWGIKCSDILSLLKTKSEDTLECHSWEKNLSEKVIDELLYLHNLKFQIDNDLANLENIFNNIVNHNSYLESQLIEHHNLINNLKKSTQKKQPGSFFGLRKKGLALLAPSLSSSAANNQKISPDNNSYLPIPKPYSSDSLSNLKASRRSIDAIKEPRSEKSPLFLSYNMIGSRNMINNSQTKPLSTSSSAGKLDHNRPGYISDGENLKTLPVRNPRSPLFKSPLTHSRSKNSPILDIPGKVPVYSKDGLESFMYQTSEVEKLQIISPQIIGISKRTIPRNSKFKFASPFPTVYYLDIFGDEACNVNILHICLVRDDLIDRRNNKIYSFDVGCVLLNIDPLIRFLDYLFPSSS
ncbi:GTPase-activating protein [Smittium mucronatum]|uniref:GTPase-activating protein n=1 Tax=Smittium mucronatum TaxID=133383 RepID=A0A1R0GX92_9FUNG|nr:GTPase-activating protein [Smittium mucronatum]